VLNVSPGRSLKNPFRIVPYAYYSGSVLNANVGQIQAQINKKDFDLKITCLASKFTHEIRYFEFNRPDDGRLITAFFQVIQKPDIVIGCFDDYPPVLEETENVVPLLRLKIPTRQLQQDY
jgi:hypothetical protein